MGNFALQTGPYNFLKLRISPWGNLFFLFLCFFSPRRLYPSFLASLAAASPFPCLFFSSPRGTKLGEQHSTRLGRIKAAAARAAVGAGAARGQAAARRAGERAQARGRQRPKRRRAGRAAGAEASTA
jgi:hypothetical protein